MIGTAFQTDDVPTKERFGYWHELVYQGYAPTSMSSGYADCFYAKQRMLELGDVQVWEASCMPSEAMRPKKLVQQSDPENCCILITHHGTLFGDTAGKNVACGVGDLYCHDTSHPGETIFRVPEGQGPYRGMSVMIPRADLPLSKGKIDQVIGTRLPRQDGLASLLSAFLTQLINDSDVLRPTDGPRLGIVVRDLISTLFAGMLDAETNHPAENRKRVLAMRIREFILHNLSDPDLTPSSIAAAHHISLSYLHQIFQSQDATVYGWIRKQRLEHARRDLADRSRCTIAVHHIAARWGFKHPADFTRAFRTAYGLTPTDYRRRPT